MRLDNLDRPVRGNPSLCVAGEIDCLWRDNDGWPQTFVLVFHELNYSVQIPAVPNHEVAEMIIADPGLDRVNTHRLMAIPKRIFQFWDTDNFDDAPVCLQKAMTTFILLNPGYEFRFYGLEGAREYILRHEGRRALKAFDDLRPVAFKADIWRLVALFHEGGFYADSKLHLIRPLDTFLPSQGGIVTDDLPPKGFANAFMGFPARDPLTRVALDLAIKNVENRDYGAFPLDITGPWMVQTAYDSLNETQKRRYLHYYLEQRAFFIFPYNDTLPVVSIHNGEYRRAHVRSGDGKSYADLWYQGLVYVLNAAQTFIAATSIRGGANGLDPFNFMGALLLLILLVFVMKTRLERKDR